MLGTKTKPSPVARPYDERQGDLSVGHVAGLGDLVRDDVPTHRKKVRKHNLGDRPKPGHGGTHRGADNGLFADRRVAHASAAELVQQANGSLEDTAGRADVLAQEDH